MSAGVAAFLARIVAEDSAPPPLPPPRYPAIARCKRGAAARTPEVRAALAEYEAALEEWRGEDGAGAQIDRYLAARRRWFTRRDLPMQEASRVRRCTQV